jgi:hypothetical protein
VFTQASDDKYTVAPFGYAIATGSPLRSAVIHFAHVSVSTASMPDYFASISYKNPNDANTGPFSYAYNCMGSSFFDYLAKPENERVAQAFNETMALQKSGEETTFVESYPATERLSISDPSRVLFVDVGGGVGHQLLKFRSRFTTLPGRLVLEDLANVVSAAVDLPQDVEKVGHDFFTPQPSIVHGAKAFYLRMILHDWPEKQARTILSHIVDAMAQDSVLLIHEVILPETGAGYFEAKMDWHLMNLGALERTEEQWKVLLGSVGLEVKGIWWEKEQMQGKRALIECGLKS